MVHGQVSRRGRKRGLEMSHSQTLSAGDSARWILCKGACGERVVRQPLR